MGEAFINQGLCNDNSGAIIKVAINSGITVICSNGEYIYEKTCNSNQIPVEFVVGYGLWTISATINGKIYTKEVNVTRLKIYEVYLLYTTYGISIDMSNSDPTTAVSYIDDAVGFTPLSVNLDTGVCDYGDWEDIITNDFGCRPCLHNDGEVVVYLDPNDYSKYDSEEEIIIDPLERLTYHTMVEFKKTWYKYSVDGNILTFQIANYDRSEDGFVCSAFKSMDGSGTVKDYMYYGAYEGAIDYEKDILYSVTGSSPNEVTGIGIDQFRTYCQNNGSSYGMEDWCKRCYLLGLLMLVTKTRDIQSAIGYGYIDPEGVCIDNGTLDKAGLFAGYNTTGKSVKAFGIENLWGNCGDFCDGVIIAADASIDFKESAPYNSSTEGYTNVGIDIPRDTAELSPTHMIVILNGSCIFPDIIQSDFSKGWCDGVRISSGHSYYCTIYVGGCYFNTNSIAGYGPFAIDGCSAISNNNYGTTCRLVFS